MHASRYLIAMQSVFSFYLILEYVANQKLKGISAVACLSLNCMIMRQSILKVWKIYTQNESL